MSSRTGYARPHSALVQTSSLASASARSGAWHCGQARISSSQSSIFTASPMGVGGSGGRRPGRLAGNATRSEEHTSELQSHLNLVSRLLLEKKTINNQQNI